MLNHLHRYNLLVAVLYISGIVYADAPTDLASRTFDGSGAGKPLNGKVIYLNPGHGSWGPNDRPLATIPYPNLSSTGRPDTCGFYESNTNLWKMEELRDRLVAAGAKVIMSRIGNGPYPYVSGASNASAYNRSLSVICEEVEQQRVNKGVDLFFSLHSNATGDGTTTNYPLMLYRGTDALEYVEHSRKMAEDLWDEHVEYMYANGFEYQSLFTQSRYVKGDVTFYGSSSTRYSNTSHIYYNGYLGALKHGAPGFLSEGYFHTYQPARHRGLSQDYCRQEGLRAYRGIIRYFGVTDNTTAATHGCIMGAVKDKSKSVSNKLYTYKSGTPDAYWPIMGAVVQLRSVNNPSVVIERDTTDNNYNGIFTFWDLPVGDYYLDVKATNYTTINGGSTNNCITTYANGYAAANSTTTYKVHVTANVTVYPYLYMTAGESTEFDINPDPPVVDPDKTYDLTLKDEGDIDVLAGKTIRRALYRDGYFYILALDGTTPYLYCVDAATRTTTTISTSGCSVKTLATYTQALPLSDIAFTDDGYLVGTNKAAVGYSSEYATGQSWRSYYWEKDDNGRPTGNPQTWHADVAYAAGSVSGNFTNAYTGESMTFSGTLNDGKMVLTAKSTGSETFRYPIYTKTGTGTYSKSASASPSSSEHNTTTYGEDLTLGVYNNYIYVDAEKVRPGYWNLNGISSNVAGVNTLGSIYGHTGANGGSWFGVGTKRMMAYPTNNAESVNTGVQVLDITSGLTVAKSVEIGAATTLPATSYQYEMAAGDYQDTVLTLYLLRDNHLYRWDNYVEPPVIHVTAIMLDKGNLRLSRGEQETLVATVLPEDAANKNFSWSTDNPAVASISDEGVVTAVATGSATITATTEDGGKTAICRITVYTPITGLTVTPTPVNVPGIGHTVQLVAHVVPEDADDQAVLWSSGDTRLATVNSTGVVTGGVPGEVTITCTARENASIQATATANVQMAGRYTVGTEEQHFGSLKGAISTFENKHAEANLVGDVTLAIATDLNEQPTGLWNTSAYSLAIEPETNTSPTVTYRTSGSTLRGGLVIGSSTIDNTSRETKEAQQITINGSSNADEQRQLKFVWSGTTNNTCEGPIVIYGNTHDCTVENMEIFNNKELSSGTASAYSLQILTERNNNNGTNRTPHHITIRNNHIESFTHPSGQSIYLSSDYGTTTTNISEATAPHDITIVDNELVATTRGIFMEGGKDITIDGNLFDVKQIVNSGYLSHGFYGTYSWGDINLRKNRFYRLHTINSHNMTSTTGRLGIHGMTLDGSATYHVENNYISGLEAFVSSNSTYDVVGIDVMSTCTAQIYHNTIVLPKLAHYPENTDNANERGVTACIFSENNRTEIKNNILVSRETAGTNAVLYSMYAPSGDKWDYNIFEYPASNAKAYAWAAYYSSTTHYNHDFESGYQKRSDGVNSDRHSRRLTQIHFANVDECDLSLVGEEDELEQLKIANPIASVTTDIVGTKRDESTPFAGAYEVFVWEDGDPVDIVDYSEQWMEINLNSMDGMTDYAVAPRVEINGLPAAVEVVDNDKHPGTPLRTYRVTPTEPLEQNEIFTINVLSNGQSIARHQYRMPIIVSSSTTMTSLPADADIVVRDGAVLTIGANLTAGRVAVNAGSQLILPASYTLTVDELYLRSRYDEVAEMQDEGTLNVNKYFFTKMLADKDRYYFMAVPHEVEDAHVGLYLTNGLRLKYNSSYRLKSYDGAARATRGLNEANWTNINSSLTPMTGYELLTSANNYREYLFPMQYTALDNTQTTDVSSHVLGSGVHPINGGWNWIANPFTETYRGAVTYNALASDYYANMYLTMYGTDGTYYQEYTGFDDVAIPPFTPIFVQVKQESPAAATEGTVTFTKSNIHHAPLRATVDTTIWTRLTLTDEAGSSDRTGVLIHPNHENEYEATNDLQKWFTAGARVQIYSTLYEDRMAFSAVNDAVAIGGVPVGYYAPKAGTMTIQYTCQQDELSRVQNVYLYDIQTGQELSILNQPYTFTTKAGEYNDRFYLRYELMPLSGEIGTSLSTTDNDGDVEIYDVLGRQLTHPKHQGVYILYSPQSGTTTKIER